LPVFYINSGDSKYENTGGNSISASVGGGGP